MKHFFFVTFSILLISQTSHSFAEKSFSFYSLYSFYNDIQQDDTLPPQPLGEDVSLNLDYRVYRLFILMAHGGASLDGERKYWGLGFKVDLPGFFLLGSNIQELLRKRKRPNVNTSIYWKNYVLSRKEQTTTFVGNRFGIITDIFLFNSTFLTIDIGLYSDDGNQYFSSSFGLGYEF